MFWAWRLPVASESCATELIPSGARLDPLRQKFCLEICIQTSSERRSPTVVMVTGNLEWMLPQLLIYSQPLVSHVADKEHEEEALGLSIYPTTLISFSTFAVVVEEWWLSNSIPSYAAMSNEERGKLSVFCFILSFSSFLLSFLLLFSSPTTPPPPPYSFPS